MRVYASENQLNVFLGAFLLWKKLEKYQNKFGSYLKSRTFALPFEKRVADEADSSWKDWRRDLPEKIFWK